MFAHKWVTMATRTLHVVLLPTEEAGSAQKRCCLVVFWYPLGRMGLSHTSPDWDRVAHIFHGRRQAIVRHLCPLSKRSRTSSQLFKARLFWFSCGFFQVEPTHCHKYEPYLKQQKEGLTEQHLERAKLKTNHCMMKQHCTETVCL